jgi:hypothetical protein
MMSQNDVLMINPMALWNCKHNNKKIYARKRFCKQNSWILAWNRLRMNLRHWGKLKGNRLLSRNSFSRLFLRASQPGMWR